MGSKVTEKTKDSFEKCKHCGYGLTKADIKRLPKKKLTPRQGVWGGMEFPYIQIFKISCPNGAFCGKSYSIRHRGSDWWYK